MALMRPARSMTLGADEEALRTRCSSTEFDGTLSYGLNACGGMSGIQPEVVLQLVTKEAR